MHEDKEFNQDATNYGYLFILVKSMIITSDERRSLRVIVWTGGSKNQWCAVSSLMQVRLIPKWVWPSAILCGNPRDIPFTLWVGTARTAQAGPRFDHPDLAEDRAR